MFRFRFESLLKHRHHLEEVAQKRLYAAEMDLRRERAQFKQIKKQRRLAIFRLKGSQAGVLAPHEISLSLQYIDKLDGQLSDQQKRVEQAEQLVATRHQALISAVKSRKIMEKLKENEHRRFKQERIKKDRKFMDEVAVNQHTRRQT